MTETTCGHPNHGARDHDCAPFRAVARVAWEVEHNPIGPIAQGVRKAVAAADRFGRELAALERECRGEVPS